MNDLNFFQCQIVTLSLNIFSLLKTDISFKRIHQLAIPALIAGIAEPLISITDTAIIGNIDFNAKESLGAIAIVGSFLSMLIWVFAQTRSAVSSIISTYLGANKLEEVKTLPAQAILIIVSLSILVISLTYPFAEYIFKIYGAEQRILVYAVEYFKIRIIGLPFTLFVFTIFGTFRGLQNTLYPMLIAISGAVLNVLFDWILVYGVEGWIPAMNVKGAAYASVISQIVMAILAGYMMQKVVKWIPPHDFHSQPSTTMEKEKASMQILVFSLHSLRQCASRNTLGRQLLRRSGKSVDIRKKPSHS